MARKTKREIDLIVDELRSLVQSGEILRYTEKDLEKRLSWTRKSIRKHLRDIKSEYGNRSLQVITIDFIETMDIMMTDIKDAWLAARKSGEEYLIEKHTNRMFKAWYQFAELLERFGIKPKAVENIDINAKIETVQLSINMDITDFNQIQELETRRV